MNFWLYHSGFVKFINAFFFNVELLTGLNDGITNDIDRRESPSNF